MIYTNVFISFNLISLKYNTLVLSSNNVQATKFICGLKLKIPSVSLYLYKAIKTQFGGLFETETVSI